MNKARGCVWFVTGLVFMLLGFGLAGMLFEQISRVVLAAALLGAGIVLGLIAMEHAENLWKGKVK